MREQTYLVSLQDLAEVAVLHSLSGVERPFRTVIRVARRSVDRCQLE